ncbi:MAG: dethiobiotin synthase [Aureliella sp.]
MNFLDGWMNRAVGHANKPENPGNPARGIFVIGTDTEVGKTYVSCVLIRHLARRGLRVGVYKPAASGLSPGVPSDAEQLIAASLLPWPEERVCPQRFVAPLAPPVAAARERRRVDDQLLVAGARWWKGQCDVLVVEGAGGALSPLSERMTVLDLAVELAYPIVLVAGHRLGMINHTLLTLEALAARQLELLALIINQVTDPSAAAPDGVQLAETLRSLEGLVGQLPCWTVAHAGTALSEVAT